MGGQPDLLGIRAVMTRVRAAASPCLVIPNPYLVGNEGDVPTLDPLGSEHTSTPSAARILTKACSTGRSR